MSTDDADTQERFPCPTCDREFDTLGGMKIHHTAAHGESIAGAETECAQCGETVRKPRTHVEQFEHSFCDDACFGAWRSENIRGEVHPNYQGKRKEHDCLNCGDTFRRYETEFVSERRFCSNRCQNEHQRTHDLDTAVCDNCGEEFEAPTIHLNQRGRSYCGKECYYLGAPREYGEGWTEAKKERVREKYGRQCQSCGVSESDLDTKLPIHHVIPAKEFDDPLERNSIDNLIPLCQSCHMRWERIPGLRPELI